MLCLVLQVLCIHLLHFLLNKNEERRIKFYILVIQMHQFQFDLIRFLSKNNWNKHEETYKKNSHWALIIKFLTPGLTHELRNPVNNWLDWLIRTNHRKNYIICMLTRELKVWRIRA